MQKSRQRLRGIAGNRSSLRRLAGGGTGGSDSGKEGALNSKSCPPCYLPMLIIQRSTCSTMSNKRRPLAAIERYVLCIRPLMRIADDMQWHMHNLIYLYLLIFMFINVYRSIYYIYRPPDVIRMYNYIIISTDNRA